MPHQIKKGGIHTPANPSFPASSAFDKGAAGASKEDLIQNMRDRIAKCDRLAANSMDNQTSRALLQMASEIERDVLRLEAAREEISQPTLTMIIASDRQS